MLSLGFLMLSMDVICFPYTFICLLTDIVNYLTANLTMEVVMGGGVTIWGRFINGKISRNREGKFRFELGGGRKAILKSKQ